MKNKENKRNKRNISRVRAGFVGLTGACLAGAFAFNVYAEQNAGISKLPVIEVDLEAADGKLCVSNDEADYYSGTVRVRVNLKASDFCAEDAVIRITKDGEENVLTGCTWVEITQSGEGENISEGGNESENTGEGGNESEGEKDEESGEGGEDAGNEFEGREDAEGGIAETVTDIDKEGIGLDEEVNEKTENTEEAEKGKGQENTGKEPEKEEQTENTEEEPEKGEGTGNTEGEPEKEEQTENTEEEKESDEGNNTQQIKEYETEIILDDDGDHVITVSYTDKDGNSAEYKSENIIIDNTPAAVSASFSEPVRIETDTAYYRENIKAELTVIERNFNAEYVSAEIINDGVIVGTVTGDWVQTGENEYKCEYEIAYEDGEYKLVLNYTDICGNISETYISQLMVIDSLKPVLSVNYSKEAASSVSKDGILTKYYNSSLSMNITVSDDFFDEEAAEILVNSVKINLGNTQREAVYKEGGTDVAEISQWENDGSTHTISISFEKDSEYAVRLKFYDMAGNYVLYGTDHFIVDSKEPVCTAAFGNPVNTVDGKKYFDASVTAVVTIKETNFFADDAVIEITKDKKKYEPEKEWKNTGGELYSTEIRLEEDGEYEFTVNYTDRSGNAMKAYMSGKIIIDTRISKPEININGAAADGGVFSGNASLNLKGEDENPEKYAMSISRVDMHGIKTDITEQIAGDMSGNINKVWSDKELNREYVLTDSGRESDGVYIAELEITDMAGHSAKSNAVFVINRHGSVYMYSDYLKKLTAGSGTYIKSITEDIYISEYNPGSLNEAESMLVATRDGRPVSSEYIKRYDEKTLSLQSTEPSWGKYSYNIKKEAFAEDGTYKISLMSVDSAGLISLSDAEEKMVFHVDSHEPEIVSVSGLEEPVINAENITVKYSVFDAMGLASVRVYVDESVIEEITDFSGDMNNHNGEFLLEEKNTVQKIRIEAADLAGNTADTSSENFIAAYEFNDEVTVSSDEEVIKAAVSEIEREKVGIGEDKNSEINNGENSHMEIPLFVKAIVLCIVSGIVISYIYLKRKRIKA